VEHLGDQEPLHRAGVAAPAVVVRHQGPNAPEHLGDRHARNRHEAVGDEALTSDLCDDVDSLRELVQPDRQQVELARV
jgi:hypothetical protein